MQEHRNQDTQSHKPCTSKPGRTLGSGSAAEERHEAAVGLGQCPPAFLAGKDRLPAMSFDFWRL